MKKNEKIFKTKSEFDNAIDIVYHFHSMCYETILKYLQEHGDIEIPEEWQDEYRYEYLDLEGVYKTIAIRLTDDKKNFYLETTNEDDGSSYDIHWDDINHDMIITEQLMDIIYNGFGGDAIEE